MSHESGRWASKGRCFDREPCPPCFPNRRAHAFLFHRCEEDRMNDDDALGKDAPNRPNFGVVENERLLISAFGLSIRLGGIDLDPLRQALAYGSTSPGPNVEDKFGFGEKMEKSIHCLHIPEMFLDEERRIVGGTLMRMERACSEQAPDPSMSMVQGRFVLNLDNTSEITASVRLGNGNICLYQRTLMDPWRYDTCMWICPEDDDQSLQNCNWPEKIISRVRFRAFSPTCSDEKGSCTCSSPPASELPCGFADWNAFIECYHRLLPARNLINFTVENKITGKYHQELSSIIVLSGHGDPFEALNMKATYLVGCSVPIPATIASHDVENRGEHESSANVFSLKETLGPPTSFSTGSSKLEIGKLLTCESELGEQLKQGLPSLESKDPKPTRRKRYPCAACPRVFNRPGCLEKHHAIAHESQALYSCETCGKSFSLSGNLKRHINMVHLRIARFFCSVCSYGFYNARDLRIHQQRRHKRTHVPENREFPR